MELKPDCSTETASKIATLGDRPFRRPGPATSTIWQQEWQPKREAQDIACQVATQMLWTNSPSGLIVYEQAHGLLPVEIFSSSTTAATVSDDMLFEERPTAEFTLAFGQDTILSQHVGSTPKISAFSRNAVRLAVKSDCSIVMGLFAHVLRACRLAIQTLWRLSVAGRSTDRLVVLYPPPLAE